MGERTSVPIHVLILSKIRMSVQVGGWMRKSTSDDHSDAGIVTLQIINLLVCVVFLVVNFA